jgi:hypothetical protein
MSRVISKNFILLLIVLAMLFVLLVWCRSVWAGQVPVRNERRQALQSVQGALATWSAMHGCCFRWNARPTAGITGRHGTPAEQLCWGAVPACNERFSAKRSCSDSIQGGAINWMRPLTQGHFAPIGAHCRQGCLRSQEARSAYSTPELPTFHLLQFQ